MPDIHADFRRPAWRSSADFQWRPSPQPGVERVLLDRVGDEVAVATSLVRYASASRFPAHEHAKGEEYLVLEGEFGDEHGRYGVGTYVRNPAGTRHAPFSDPGCVIWVKLRQFHPDDRRQTVDSIDLPMPREGVASKELHRFEDEVVSVLAAPARTTVELGASTTVQEVFVISGEVSWQHHALPARSWLRLPAGEGAELQVASNARLLHKTRPAFAVPGVKAETASASAGT